MGPKFNQDGYLKAVALMKLSQSKVTSTSTRILDAPSSVKLPKSKWHRLFLFFPFVIWSPTHVYACKLCLRCVHMCMCCCNKWTDMATVVMEINEMQSLMARWIQIKVEVYICMHACLTKNETLWWWVNKLKEMFWFNLLLIDVCVLLLQWQTLSVAAWSSPRWHQWPAQHIGDISDKHNTYMTSVTNTACRWHQWQAQHVGDISDKHNTYMASVTNKTWVRKEIKEVAT